MDKIRENVERHMTELCLRIGSRHVGSEGEAKAADYIETCFQSFGYQPVREDYPVTGWNFQNMEFINLTQKRSVPAATPCFFSNSTVLEGKLLWLAQKELENLDKIPVAGRLCMVECFSGRVFARNKIAEDLDRLGAKAAIFISDVHTTMAPSTKIQRSPFLKHLATVAVSQEGAFDLARHKDDTYRLVINAKNFPHRSANIIARQEGTGPRCVFGGHFDTAPLVQGAGDNATGTVMVLEMARLLKGKYPQIPMDFVTFSAEEYIPETLPPGSGNYLDRHLDEGIRWFMNFDDIGLLIGNPQLRIGHQEKLPPTFHPVDVPFVVAGQDGDDKGFFLAGIPTIFYHDENPFRQLHTIYDALDTIDFDKMTFIIKDALALLEQLLPA